MSSTIRGSAPRLLSLLLVVLTLPAAPARELELAKLPAEIQAALANAGENRTELETALREAPPAQEKWLHFLLEHMPVQDLRSLKAAFLLENIALAAEARSRLPWGTSIPEEIFLNDVLPYAVLNERRDAWRGKLFDQALPLVAGAKSPGEAAHLLNQKLFALNKVQYSTRRKRPDQSPLETIESGVATCSGLSILWIDACRAVCIPARAAGIANWPNKRGNHTWVEVWDEGWHFGGAAEPDGRGLDHTWFEGDASRAIPGSRENGVFASSYRRTGLSFPLVWAPEIDWIPAIDVSARYAGAAPQKAGTGRLLVRAVQSRERVEAQVEVLERDNPGMVLRGTTRGERADLNDLLAFEAPAARVLVVTLRAGVEVQRREVAVPEGKDLTVDFQVGTGPGLDSGVLERLQALVAEHFLLTPEARKEHTFPGELDLALATHPHEVRTACWNAYRGSPIHAQLREDFAASRVRTQHRESAYVLRKVGEKPEGGWPVFIALHGGGNAPREVNDSQWRIMQKYYRDQAGAGGYLYLALRAPNDTWNGFYDDAIGPLIETLVRQLLVNEDVDPDRVCILGYSHGGYGAFVIGTKVPHRFAAVHSSAAAPTDGETAGRNLRNTVFTYMVGINDRAYGRFDRCVAFDRLVRELRGERTDIYPVTFEPREGFGHTGLPDRDKILSLSGARRNAAPREISWDLTDSSLRSFFWLEVTHPGEGQSLDAVARENRIEVSTRGVGDYEVLLDERLVDFSRPITLAADGVVTTHTVRPSLSVLCSSLLERGDPRLSFTVSLKGSGRLKKL